MGPIDYTSALSSVPNPADSFLQSFQGFNAVRQNQLLAQQQQAALERQQQMRQDLMGLSQNPTPDAIAKLSIRYPQLSESFKRSYDMLNTQQQEAKVSAAIPVYAALQSGRPDLAAQKLRDTATAMENSGNADEAQRTRAWADMIEQHPEQAKLTSGLLLSSVMGPDKFASTFSTLGQESRASEQAPADLAIKQAEARKTGAEATTAEVAAGNAPVKTQLDNQLAFEDVETKRLKRDLDRLDAQIKTANSETDRGRLTLERDKLNAELQQKQQDKAQAAQDGMDALTQGLQTIESIRKSAGLDSNMVGLGGVGSATGKLAGMIPGTDRKDLEGLVTTLKSQQFLAGVKQLSGMGALSNAEGDKIGSAVASLDLDQSPAAFKNALGVIEANLRKAQAKAVAGGKLPTTGGAVVLQSPKYGVVTEGQINALLKQYPGSTREQVMQFLQTQGGR